MSIDVSAAVVKKSAADMRSFYGDYVNISYEYEGAVYSTSASYYGVVSSYDLNSIASNAIIPSTSALSSYDVILYQASVQAGNWMYSDVVVEGFYTRFDNYARGGFVGSVDGLGYSGFSVSDSRNSVSNWGNNYAGNFAATLSRDSVDYYGFASSLLNPSYPFYVPLRMIQYEFQNGGVIESVHFDGLRSDNRAHLFIGVICPYVDGDFFNEPAVTTVPVTTAPSGTGDINVNVDVDMTETNGLLGSILDAISSLGSSIVNGIKNIFLPDQEDIVNWKQTIVNILNETFGGIPELEQQLKNAISSIFSATARETVRFEGIKVPAAAGEPEAVIVPAQDVPLKPSGFGDLFSWVETFINIVATIAVANTCFNQIKRIVVGEVVVDAD